MIVLLLPLVAAILLCERHGVLYPEENIAYDSLLIHHFVITSEAKSTAKCERFEARTFGGNIFLYIARDSVSLLPQQGDTVIATTRIKRADSIGSFDYRKYLLRQGIIGTAYVRYFSVRKADVAYQAPLQKRLYRRLAAAGLDGDERATVGALTLGYKEDLDPALKHRFQASGAAHVLAVSGLHTGIIYSILIGLLTFGGRIRPMHENQAGRCAISGIIIAAMWGYAWLTGMTPSVVRAVLMVTLVETGRMVYRNSLSINTIASAAVLILLARPLDLWSVSFQLSFAATAAIVLLMPVSKYLGIPEGRLPKIVRYFLGIIFVSLAAQLGTLPITMYTFGQISNYFLLTNLIVLPLAAILVPCGLISIALGGNNIGLIFSKITNLLAWAMNHSVGWIESLPGSTTHVSIGLGMVVIYYVMFLLFCYFFTRKY